MIKVRAYDLPHRILHWATAVFFLSSFLIAKNVDDESWIYALHMLSGLCLGFVVVLRLVWGVFGSETARLKNLITSPVKVALYFKKIFSKADPRSVPLGHNPASSVFAWFVFLFSMGLVVTGLMMANDYNKETVEEIHELLANGFLIAVLGHVAGLILHSFRFRDFIPFSMITGNKNFSEPREGIPSQRLFAALGIVLLLAGFMLFLANSFDANTGMLFDLKLVDLVTGESN